MYSLVFSPKWFFGIDILFEIVTIFIAMLISFYGYKIYKLSKTKEHKYFSISFFLVALSFVFKILTNFDVYFSVLKPLQVGSKIVLFNYLYSSGILHLAGLLVFRFLMLMAFFILFLLTERKHPTKDICLMVYLLFISVIFSITAYYIFHITLAGIMLLLCLNSYKDYRKTRKCSKLNVFLAFLFILASQLSFFLIFLELEFYVLGETLMLAGFFIFLYNYLAVSRK